MPPTPTWRGLHLDDQPIRRTSKEHHKPSTRDQGETCAHSHQISPARRHSRVLTLGTITVTGTAASAVNVRAVAVMSPSTASIDSPSLAGHLHVRHLHVRHVRSAPTTASPASGPAAAADRSGTDDSAPVLLRADRCRPPANAPRPSRDPVSTSEVAAHSDSAPRPSRCDPKDLASASAASAAPASDLHKRPHGHDRVSEPGRALNIPRFAQRLHQRFDRRNRLGATSGPEPPGIQHRHLTECRATLNIPPEPPWLRWKLGLLVSNPDRGGLVDRTCTLTKRVGRLCTADEGDQLQSHLPAI